MPATNAKSFPQKLPNYSCSHRVKYLPIISWSPYLCRRTSFSLFADTGNPFRNRKRLFSSPTTAAIRTNNNFKASFFSSFSSLANILSYIKIDKLYSFKNTLPRNYRRDTNPFNKKNFKIIPFILSVSKNFDFIFPINLYKWRLHKPKFQITFKQ